MSKTIAAARKRKQEQLYLGPEVDEGGPGALVQHRKTRENPRAQLEIDELLVVMRNLEPAEAEPPPGLALGSNRNNLSRYANLLEVAVNRRGGDAAQRGELRDGTTGGGRVRQGPHQRGEGAVLGGRGEEALKRFPRQGHGECKCWRGNLTTTG